MKFLPLEKRKLFLQLRENIDFTKFSFKCRVACATFSQYQLSFSDKHHYQIVPDMEWKQSRYQWDLIRIKTQ